jgi:urease accessory protein
MINKDNSIQTKISISCVREGEKTLLKNSAFDIPYKVVHYGAKSLTKHLEIMMMCYSPGVMDGDDLSVEVSCKAGAEMKLFTQSFNKLHPMKSGAKQTFIAHIEKGALFQFLPCPTIPFKYGVILLVVVVYIQVSRFSSLNSITLQKYF